PVRVKADRYSAQNPRLAQGARLIGDHRNAGWSKLNASRECVADNTEGCSGSDWLAAVVLVKHDRHLPVIREIKPAHFDNVAVSRNVTRCRDHADFTVAKRFDIAREKSLHYRRAPTRGKARPSQPAISPCINGCENRPSALVPVDVPALVCADEVFAASCAAPSAASARHARSAASRHRPRRRCARATARSSAASCASTAARWCWDAAA